MLKDELLDSLKKQGFNEKIIKAFEKVRRENFVPEQFAPYSYDDVPLPIWTGATISQPSTIAFMLNLLNPEQGNKILEIGSGSGYVLALLAEIIKNGKIYGLELIQKLALKSKNVLGKSSIIEIIIRSGEQGLPEHAPFDRIIVSFSCPDRYLSALLVDQLTPNGILVVPVKNSIFQYKKESGKVTEKEFPGFSFVPMVKREG